MDKGVITYVAVDEVMVKVVKTLNINPNPCPTQSCPTTIYTLILP